MKSHKTRDDDAWSHNRFLDADLNIQCSRRRKAPGWVGREVYLTIEATRSAGYCRVVSSETVHCEGSSGSHPLPRYRTNPRPSSHGPRRTVTRIPLQVTHTYTHTSLSLNLLGLYVYLLPNVTQASSMLRVRIHVAVSVSVSVCARV